MGYYILLIVLCILERLLAAQNPLSQADRPHQLFADAPPPPAAPQAPVSAVAPPPPPPSSTGVGPPPGGPGRHNILKKILIFQYAVPILKICSRKKEIAFKDSTHTWC